MNCGSVVYRFMMPRYCPELAPPLDGVLALAFSSLSWASDMSREVRFACVECEDAVFSRLISTPRNAKGAQQATDHDLPGVSSKSHIRSTLLITYTPQKAIMMVACLKLFTKGAMHILLANMQ